MADLPSKSQLDRLGERLRAGVVDSDDLKALDAYRRSFRPAYDVVTRLLKERLSLEGTGRPAKTTASIIDKLKRQRIRLTQIQDIAGVRLLTTNVVEQDDVTAHVNKIFGDVAVDDRRISPSHGYRAVHQVVVVEGRQVEIQVRTIHQHRWAEISEKLADEIDPAIKYGGGPDNARLVLTQYSEQIEAWEETERKHVVMRQAASMMREIAKGNIDESLKKTLLTKADEFESTVKRQDDEIGAHLRRLGDIALADLGNIESDN